MSISADIDQRRMRQVLAGSYAYYSKDLRPFERLVMLAGDSAGRISVTYHPIWLTGFRASRRG